MIKHLLLLFLSVIVFCNGISQSVIVSGTLEDAQSGEQLVAGNIYEATTLHGTVTNYYGYYSLKLPAGKAKLIYSYIGYQPIEIELNLLKDTVINISLTPAIELEEVVITDKGPAATVQSAQMSMIKLPIEQTKQLPVLLGETDVLKAIQLLPGVQSGTEGLSGIFVRGGSPDQNLILLDGVPVYNVNHLFGFFSVFNADAIQNVSLIKGGFPGRYGGRLSSVLDIKMKEGNMKEFKGEGSIGLISSKLTLEGPIIKDRTSFIVSARRTYFDVLTWPIQKAYVKSQGNDFDELAGYFFHDINAKINHKFSPNSRLYFSLYTGLDKAYMRYEDKWEDYQYSYEDVMKFHLKWGNLTSALRWNYVIKPNLFSNATLTYSRYKIDIGDTWSWKETGPDVNQNSEYAFSYISGIEDFGGKVDFDYMPNPNHTVRFGINNTYHTFKPGIQVTKFEQEGDITESLDTSVGNSNIYANEMDLYIEDEVEIWGRVKANLGLHYSSFFVRDAWYHSFQPRIAARVLITDKISYKASYAEMMQYIHLLANSSLGMPTDLWVPATDATRPERSKQVASGFAFDVGNNLELTLEGYYKIMEDVIEYKEGAEYFEVLETWENKIERGKGWAYGGEIMLQKQAGKTTGWVCYTLSWAERQFENISQGKVFPYKYDRRHDVAIVVSHKFNDHIDGCVTWVYGTGYHITLGEEMYANPFFLFQNNFGPNPDFNYLPRSTMIEHIENRNNYTMPAYHRMDVGINLHKEKEHYTRTWSLGAYNAYDRQNAFMIFADYDWNIYNGESGKKKIQQVTLFPIIPYFRYSISF